MSLGLPFEHPKGYETACVTDFAYFARARSSYTKGCLGRGRKLRRSGGDTFFSQGGRDSQHFRVHRLVAGAADVTASGRRGARMEE